MRVVVKVVSAARCTWAEVSVEGAPVTRLGRFDAMPEFLRVRWSKGRIDEVLVGGRKMRADRRPGKQFVSQEWHVWPGEMVFYPDCPVWLVEALAGLREPAVEPGPDGPPARDLTVEVGS